MYLIALFAKEETSLTMYMQILILIGQKVNNAIFIEQLAHLAIKLQCIYLTKKFL